MTQVARGQEDRDWNGPFWARNIRDGKVVRGKGGWLFLANDSSDVLRQHAGELTLSAEDVQGWQELLEARQAMLSARRIAYFFMVAPDTHSVYPEKLPEGFEPTPERPIHKLFNHLGDVQSSAQIIYPLKEMVDEKPNALVCSAYDTHWTEFGALIGYERLMEEVRKAAAVRQIPREHVLFHTRMMPGELSVKLGFGEDVEHLLGQVYARARLLEDNRVFNRGSLAVLECEQAPPTTCILFGDSYSLMMLRFLAESFRRLVFAHSPTIDYGLIERERPDVVVSLLAERFLIKVPDDREGPTVEEVAREKLAQGRLRQRLPMWDWRPESMVVPTPLETVERIRAHLLRQDRQTDVTLVSLLAYAGLDPATAIGLRWEDFADGKLRLAARAGALARSVNLLAPLQEDLVALRRAGGESADGHLFRLRQAWDSTGRGEWRTTVFQPAAQEVGATGVEPGKLRHCLGALLVRSGASWSEVAEQVGMTPPEALSTYGHLAEELYREGPISASEQISAARRDVASSSTTGRSGRNGS